MLARAGIRRATVIERQCREMSEVSRRTADSDARERLLRKFGWVVQGHVAVVIMAVEGDLFPEPVGRIEVIGIALRWQTPLLPE